MKEKLFIGLAAFALALPLSVVNATEEETTTETDGNGVTPPTAGTDGNITPAELAKFEQNVQKRLRKVKCLKADPREGYEGVTLIQFPMDADGDGRVSAAEAKAYRAQRVVAEEAGAAARQAKLAEIEARKAQNAAEQTTNEASMPDNERTRNLQRQLELRLAQQQAAAAAQAQADAEAEVTEPGETQD